MKTVMVRQRSALSQALDLGKDCFAHLAGQAGMDSRGFRLAQHWIKNDANRSHIVLRFDGGECPLILKQLFRSPDPAEFSGILEAHLAAQAALAGHARARVPEILAADRDLKACLMRYQPGETLRDLCQTHADHGPFLRQAGVWLSAYHRATFQQARDFQPRFMARHMLHLVDQMRAGTRRIRGQKRFIELAHQVQDLVPACQGRSSVVAAKHGDMNAHNLLIDRDTVAAFDFRPLTYAPVGYDIARLLMSYALAAVDPASIPKRHVLPPQALQAFFDGYDLVGPDDPGVTFLLRVQILTDWNRMADKSGAQTLIAFERLRAIAHKAFA